MPRIVNVTALICASLVTGCMTEPDDETLDSTEQALSGIYVFSWGTTNGDPKDLNISSSGWTCFLSGVAGNLGRGTNTTAQGRASTAGVFKGINGHWWIEGHGGRYLDGTPYNNPVNARATCVPLPEVSTGTWHKTVIEDQVDAVDLGPADGRQCYLTRVHGVAGSWAPDNSSMRVGIVYGHWYLYGTNMYGSIAAGHAGGDAACVTPPQGTTIHEVSRTASPNDPAGTITLDWSTGGTGCMLHSVTGSFDVDSWTDGVLHNPPPAPPGYWTLSYVTGKGFTEACMD